MRKYRYSGHHKRQTMQRPNQMAQMPIIHSGLLRILCALKRPLRRYYVKASIETKSTRPWPHEPAKSANISISDDLVARLASKPLHSLSLADLVK